jgi:hypothetical protein
MTDDRSPNDSSAVQPDENAEEETALDVFCLQRVPPKRTYTMTATFYDAGKGQPLPYDFGDFFDDEELPCE